VEHPAADLLELRNECTRISPSERRRIDFSNQQVGCRQVYAARETGLIRISRKRYQLSLASTHTAMPDQCLGAVQIMHHRDAFLGRPLRLVQTSAEYKEQKC
jgi:hypothetical protein